MSSSLNPPVVVAAGLAQRVEKLPHVRLAVDEAHVQRRQTACCDLDPREVPAQQRCLDDRLDQERKEDDPGARETSEESAFAHRAPRFTGGSVGAAAVSAVAVPRARAADVDFEELARPCTGRGSPRSSPGRAWKTRTPAAASFIIAPAPIPPTTIASTSCPASARSGWQPPCWPAWTSTPTIGVHSRVSVSTIRNPGAPPKWAHTGTGEPVAVFRRKAEFHD